jgi:MFS family permease
MTAFCLISVRQGPEPRQAPPHAETTPAPSAVLGNSSIWLLSAAFACFNMAVLAFGTYLPTYLVSVHGLELAQAARLASIPLVINIFCGPLAGVLSDRLGSRKRVYLAGLVLAALALPLAGLVQVEALVVLVVLQGFFLSLVPANIFSAAVETAGDERQSGLAMAVVMVGQNAGMLLGPVVFGVLIESAGGWQLAFGSLAVVCLVGALAGWLARVK